MPLFQYLYVAKECLEPRAILYSQPSRVVEQIAGFIGAAAVTTMEPILPYTLSFAAGAIIYVVAEYLIPESQAERHLDIPTIGVLLGFALMMTLDVALG